MSTISGCFFFRFFFRHFCNGNGGGVAMSWRKRKKNCISFAFLKVRFWRQHVFFSPVDLRSAGIEHFRLLTWLLPHKHHRRRSKLRSQKMSQVFGLRAMPQSTDDFSSPIIRTHKANGVIFMNVFLHSSPFFCAHLPLHNFNECFIASVAFMCERNEDDVRAREHERENENCTTKQFSHHTFVCSLCTRALSTLWRSVAVADSLFSVVVFTLFSANIISNKHEKKVERIDDPRRQLKD